MTIGGSPTYVINPKGSGVYWMGDVAEAEATAYGGNQFIHLPGCLFGIADVESESMPGLMVLDDPHLVVRGQRMDFTITDEINTTDTVKQRVRIVL